MPKFMYVLWKPADMPSEDFQRSLIEEKGPALLDHGVDQLAINLTDIAPSAVERPREDGSSVNALVSIELASKAEAQAIAEILDPTGRGIAGYEVEEAIPVDYDRDWPDGERSPGAKQVTLLRRKPGLSDEAFFHHWIDVHAPLAIEVHPLWRYNRNVVLGAVTPDAPGFEGLVELHMEKTEELTDLMQFFGSPENIKRITDDVVQWIDMEKLEVYNMSERILKS